MTYEDDLPLMRVAEAAYTQMRDVDGVDTRTWRAKNWFIAGWLAANRVADRKEADALETWRAQ